MCFWGGGEVGLGKNAAGNALSGSSRTWTPWKNLQAKKAQIPFLTTKYPVIRFVFLVNIIN